jgi:hypothetical protein
MRHLDFMMTLLALATLGLSTKAYSDTPNEQAFEEQVQKADAVIVGVAGRQRIMIAKSQFGADVELQTTEIAVVKVLKGGIASKSITLVTRGDVSDLDPKCCRIGAKYIFALRRGQHDMYEVYNGRFSAIKI